MHRHATHKSRALRRIAPVPTLISLPVFSPPHPFSPLTTVSLYHASIMLPTPHHYSAIVLRTQEKARGSPLMRRGFVLICVLRIAPSPHTHTHTPDPNRRRIPHTTLTDPIQQMELRLPAQNATVLEPSIHTHSCLAARFNNVRFSCEGRTKKKEEEEAEEAPVHSRGKPPYWMWM